MQGLQLERDYGGESIEILLQYMENHRDDLVVILAGYADRMETFFTANPGMSSRIAHHLEFPDYTHHELAAIGDMMLGRQGYRLSDEAQAVPMRSRPAGCAAARSCGGGGRQRRHDSW